MKLWNRFINWIAGPNGWFIGDDPNDQLLAESRREGRHVPILPGRIGEPPQRPVGINIEDHIHHCEQCQEQREMFLVEQNDHPA